MTTGFGIAVAVEGVGVLGIVGRAIVGGFPSVAAFVKAPGWGGLAIVAGLAIVGVLAIVAGFAAWGIGGGCGGSSDISRTFVSMNIIASAVISISAGSIMTVASSSQRGNPAG